MKIKKYQASTETDAMLKIKDELGKEALIVNVKRIKPKGIYKLFKKPYVEVTAALDDKSMVDDATELNQYSLLQEGELVSESENGAVKSDSNESFVQLIKDFAKSNNKGMSNPNLEKNNDDTLVQKVAPSVQEQMNRCNPNFKIVYEQLLENEVAEEYVNQLMTDLGDVSEENGGNIDEIVSIVYKRLVKLLGDVDAITLDDEKPKTIAFVGPTGVGKTTTIAKLASYYTLNKNKKVALITSDTYRIAAVEQLRTYANILDIPIKVVYTTDELIEATKELRDVDLIFIDTAGRSHNNNEHINDLAKLINSVEDVSVYLVVSLSTKLKDLLKISQSYNDISEYKLIFTKLDETSCYGNILNLKLKTKANLSYMTYGQNVPDDICKINVYDIAKKTLGGCE
jgi:flagellar biosynthesis protein FlhF